MDSGSMWVSHGEGVRVIHGDHLLTMANYYLSGLFLSLAQKSEVPVST